MSELPKIVLQRLAAPPAAEHPAPDLLAAFVEKRLAGSEREKLLAHLAVCGTCREVIWRATPEAETQSPVAGVAGTGAWRLPAWRWVGAAAAVLVIATVAVFYRGGPGAAGEKVASSAGVAAVHAPAPPPSAPAAADLQASNTVNSSNAPKPSHSPRASNALEASNNPANLIPPAGRVQAAARSRSSAGLNAASGAAPAPMAKTAEPAPASTAKAEVAIASGIMAPAMGKKKLAPPTRWMISPQGALLRSTDAGRSWQAVPFGGNIAFQTVAVVGSRVWAGGRGGALYYSPDGGSQWSRLGPAATAPLNQDVRALKFQDGQHGSLTTADGQTWTTSDSGQSWQKQ